MSEGSGQDIIDPAQAHGVPEAIRKVVEESIHSSRGRASARLPKPVTAEDYVTRVHVHVEEREQRPRRPTSLKRLIVDPRAPCEHQGTMHVDNRPSTVVPNLARQLVQDEAKAELIEYFEGVSRHVSAPAPEQETVMVNPPSLTDLKPHGRLSPQPQGAPQASPQPCAAP